MLPRLIPLPMYFVKVTASTFVKSMSLKTTVFAESFTKVAVVSLAATSSHAILESVKVTEIFVGFETVVKLATWLESLSASDTQEPSQPLIGSFVSNTPEDLKAAFGSVIVIVKSVSLTVTLS